MSAAPQLDPAKQKGPSAPRPVVDMVARLVGHAAFSNTVLALIFGNAILLGLETTGLISAQAAWVHNLERFILWAFTVELVLRFVAELPRWTAPLTNGWYLFDLFIVGLGHLLGGAGFVQVLRLLRVMRLLRLLSVIPTLQRMVGAVLDSLPSMGSIMLLLGLLFYVYGILGVTFFGAVAPEDFGNLTITFMTLFEVVTLEGWIDIMAPIQAQLPFAWVYFVSFILLGTFVVFNLFVGVIVGTMEENSRADDHLIKEADETQAELARLTDEIAELKQMIRELKQQKDSA